MTGVQGKKVLLKAFLTHTEAALLQSFLEYHGIDSEMRDTHINSIQHLYSNFTGGIKIFVLESQLEEAKRIIEEADQNEIELSQENLPQELKESSEKEGPSPVRLKNRILVLMLYVIPILISLIFYFKE
ncbi:MAG: hypothetical protein HOO06_11760 [Bdellovibrionaceae bacterium]|jgi:hypothetical protein|nr:hypothetical protein [Pseudobdellovibrionaceae bacterium]